MPISPTSILKGLIVREEESINPKEIEITPGGAAGTKTTLTSSQTQDIEIILPNVSGPLANAQDIQDDLALKADITYVDSEVAAVQTEIDALEIVVDNLQTQVDGIETTANSAIQSASSVGGAVEVLKGQTGTDIEIKTLEAGTNVTLDNSNPDKIVINASGGGGGANTSLNNLTATNVNQDLLAFVGTDGNVQRTWTIGTHDQASATWPPVERTADLRLKTGSTSFGYSGDLTIETGSSGSINQAVSSGAITIRTGNGTLNYPNVGQLTLTTGTLLSGKTGNIVISSANAQPNMFWPLGFADTGDITIKTGITGGGTQGKIKLQNSSNGTGTTGTIGHVWTQTAADGSGAWQAASGGGGVDPNYTSVSPSTSNSTTVSGATFEDTFQFNRDLTITPTGANEKWEIYFTGTMIVSPNAIGNQLMDVAIMNQALSSIIDGASARFRYYATVANSDVSYKEIPVTLMAKVTLSAATTYRIGHLYGGVGSGNGVFRIGDNAHGAGPARFWAKRVY